MKYFNRNYFVDNSESLAHTANKQHAAYGTVGSVSSEKGTDGKKNNTSEYNHDYYEDNKEKWADNKSSTTKSDGSRSNNDSLYYDANGNARFGHKDFDPNDPDFTRTDGTTIPGTNLKMFTNANGSTIVLGDGIKFSFPPGTNVTPDMSKKLAEVEGNKGSLNKEQYVAKMLNSVTGFMDKQGVNDGGEKKSSGSKKESSGEKTEAKEDTSKKTVRSFDEAKKEYFDTKKKTSSVKHADWGSIRVKDIF